MQSKRLTAGLSHLPSAISFELKCRLRTTTFTASPDCANTRAHASHTRAHSVRVRKAPTKDGLDYLQQVHL